MKETNIKEIILCQNCKGYGESSERVSAYESEIVDCKSCNGSGRIIKIIITKFIPYKEGMEFSAK